MNHQVGIRSSYMLGIHDHSSPAQGGAVPQVSVTGHSKAVHDALAINADQVDGVEENAIVTAARVNAFITKVAIDALGVNADQVDGEEAAAIVTEARVGAVLTKAQVDALAVNADQVDGEEAAAIVTEARVGAVLTKAQVDALAVNAGQVDGVDLPGTPANVLSPRDVTVGVSVVSDGLRSNSPNEKSTASAVYVIVKQIRINEITGALRVKIQLKSGGGNAVYCWLKKNGVSVGGAHTTSNVAYQDYSDDIGACAANDTLEFWCKIDAAETAFIRNFSLCYDRPFTHIGGVELSDNVASKALYSVTNQDP